MGMVRTEITLKNARDKTNAMEGIIKTDTIRSVTTTAVADTGALYLVISEEIRDKLGLAYDDERTANIANGQSIRCKTTEAVEVNWKNRRTLCSALVIPGAKAVLLGAIPLEGMDLMVNPVTQEVAGAHGDEIITYCF
jgi:clan AA aspartic protease